MAFWRKPSASYFACTSRVQHISQLCDTFQAAEGLWWHLQPLLACVRSRRSADTSRLLHDKFPSCSPPKTEKPPSTVRAPLVISWPWWVDGKGDCYQQTAEAATEQLHFGDVLHWCIACHQAEEKKIHSSCVAALPESKSLFSVIWILFTSLISSYHQLVNKLFIRKFINYSTSSIDDWIILTK